MASILKLSSTVGPRVSWLSNQPSEAGRAADTYAVDAYPSALSPVVLVETPLKASHGENPCVVSLASHRSAVVVEPALPVQFA